MKKEKNNNGITLIALVITIILLIILASIGIYSGAQVVKSAKLTAFSTELKIMQTHVNSLYEKKKNGEKVRINNVEEQVDNIGTDISNSSNKVQSQANEVFTTNASGITVQTGYKYYDNSTIKSLNIEGVEGDFFVNIDKRSVISYDGFEYEGTTYYTLNQIPNNLYNVDYNESEATSKKPTFDVTASWIKSDECVLSVSAENINYNGNISKWNLQYKLENEEEFKESKGLSTKIDKAGTYKIKIANGNFKSDEITKTIYEPQDNNYIKNNIIDYYGHYVTNYNSPNDAGINASNGRKWQIFMADDTNIYLIASNYITVQYTGKKGNQGYNYNTSEPTKMWFTNIKNQYNANATTTDIPNLLSKLDKQSIYHKWMNTTENQTRDYDNEKAVASMIDVDLWSGYNNTTYAKYAIGGPTLEMFCKGYNDSYEADELVAQNVHANNNTYGYRIKKGTNDATETVSELKVGPKNDFVNNMYFRETAEGRFYWLASNSTNRSDAILYVGSGGRIFYDYDNSTNFGFRPLVCLKSNMFLLKNEDGETYSILDL